MWEHSKLLILSGCFGIVLSSPNPLINDEKAIILGLISCGGIFGLLVACLFCKRQKRKFEKFENEALQNGPATSLSTNEYPIFRALNAPTSSCRTSSTMVHQTVNNRSSDNLLEDNNNRVVSRDDLDNIENNAEEFIPALNTSQILIENEVQISTQVANDYLLQTTSLSKKYHTSKDDTTDCSLTSVSILIHTDEVVDAFGDVNFSPTAYTQKTIDEVYGDQHLIRCGDNKQSWKLYDDRHFNDNASLSSVSSGFSHNMNSVEEALRVLDFVIDGADTSPDEPLMNYEDIDTSTDVVKSMINIESDVVSDKKDEELKNEYDKDQLSRVATILVDRVLEKALYCIDSKILHNDSFVFNIPENDEVSKQDPFEKFSTYLEATSTPALQAKNFNKERCKTNKLDVKRLDYNNVIEEKSMTGKNVSNVPIETDFENTISEGNETHTPMNTPNEQIFQNIDNWNRLVAMNLMKNKPADTDLHDATAAKDLQKTFENKVFNETYEKIDIWEDDGWFLHNQNKPNDIDLNNDTYGIMDDNDLEKFNYDRDKSIAQLRELLGSTLSFSVPGNGNTALEYSDDEDVWKHDEPVQQISASNINNVEVFLNYNKRCLSPIMEESEDETYCKTFVMNNETRCLDSTSTGCVESEAIMGVTKEPNIHSSNDTLFNFEDTLCDENIFSPRTISRIDSVQELGATAIISKQASLELPVESSLANEKYALNDLLSPDQEPDLTFTVEEKTCITVKYLNSNEEERISEISEPDLMYSSLGKNDKTEDDDDLTSIEEDLPEEPYQCSNDVQNVYLSRASGSESESTPKLTDLIYSTTLCDAVDSVEPKGNDKPYLEEPSINECLNKNVVTKRDSDICNDNQMSPKTNYNKILLNVDALNENSDDANFWNICDKVLQESRIENVNFDNINALVKHRENNYVIQEIDLENFGDAQTIGLNLSGEEDPWVATNVRVAAPFQDFSRMPLSVCEWESGGEEDDDSKSSEEFMYLYIRGRAIDKGLTEVNLARSPNKEENQVLSLQETTNSAEDPIKKNGQDIWHNNQTFVESIEDEIPAILSPSDSEEDEGEFIPSSWNSTVLPSRSAMKSPDKTIDSSEKKRKNVVFKIQKYHSVYEYPKEIYDVSPAYSEPKLGQSFEKFIEQQIVCLSKNDFDSEKHDDLISKDIDGFMISSSTRPFHCTAQFHSQCKTWPGDTVDFSWSQIEGESGDVQWKEIDEDMYRPLRISRNSNDDIELDHPDSGVGESFLQGLSNECSTMSSLGELRHAKRTLNLPIQNIILDLQTSHTSIVQFSNNFVNPTSSSSSESHVVDENKRTMNTPSCTGSMDSLSSSNDSNKEPHSDPNLVEDISTRTGQFRQESSTRLSDSTDEDSGIENLTRPHLLN